jgi:tyrosinase
LPHGCVTDGILGDISPSYLEGGYVTHCVTRNFDINSEDGEMHGKHYTPDILKDIIETSETYNDFRERLENGPHRHLHLGIGGEMPTISSTNGILFDKLREAILTYLDPLFFVHHAQIDRLWWLWQQRNPTKRNHEFFGSHESKDSMNGSGAATLEDKIMMLGLAQDRPVHDVLTTSSDILCYKYSMEY